MCIKLVKKKDYYYIRMHGQQNIKKKWDFSFGNILTHIICPVFLPVYNRVQLEYGFIWAETCSFYCVSVIKIWNLRSSWMLWIRRVTGFLLRRWDQHVVPKRRYLITTILKMVKVCYILKERTSHVVRGEARI